MASQNVELGQAPPADARRDAIHVAIIPATWVDDEGYSARAGYQVRFDGDGNVSECNSADWEGIVDPFFEGFVESGQRVWILMRPGAVKQLRHTWEHVSVEEDSV